LLLALNQPESPEKNKKLLGEGKIKIEDLEFWDFGNAVFYMEAQISPKIEEGH